MRGCKLRRQVPIGRYRVLENRDGVDQTIADQPRRITPAQPSPIEGEGSNAEQPTFRSSNS